MSDFDDLLNFGAGDLSENKGQTTGLMQNTSGGDTGGGNLLDFDFDSSNDNSAKLSFEPNTNPLYEFTNSKMATDSNDLLYDFGSVPLQKGEQQESSNPLYNFLQCEETNGHGGDIFTNGGQNEDLLGGYADNLHFSGISGHVISDDSSVTVDTNILEDTQPRDVTEYRERSESEASEEQDIDGNIQTEQTEAVEPILDHPQHGTENVVDESLEEEGVDGKAVGEIVRESSEANVKLRDGTNVGDDDIQEPEPDANVDDVVDEICDSEGDVEKQELDDAEYKKKLDTHEHCNDDDNLMDNRTENNTEHNEENYFMETTKKHLQAFENDQLLGSPAVDSINNITDEVADTKEMASSEMLKVEPLSQDETSEQPGENDICISEQVQQEEMLPIETKDDEDVPEPISETLEQKTSDEELVPIAEEQLHSYQEQVETIGTEEIIEKSAADQEHFDNTNIHEVTGVDNVAEPVEQEQIQSVTADADFRQPLEETLDEGNNNFQEVPEKTNTLESVDHYRNIQEIETEHVMNVNGSSDFSENGTIEEDSVKDPNIVRETHEKEQVHFSEMDSVRKKFESGTASHEESKPHKVDAKEDMGEGGEYESTPIINPDVVKETDQPQEELPEAGMAKNLVNRFKSIQEEKAQPAKGSKRVSPPREVEKVEYESQPQQSSIHYETKTDSGVFESEPKAREDVIRSGETTEDYQPEKGYAKNIMNKFKEIQTESSKHKATEKREITPDRSGKVEYVSEPRGQHIVYTEAASEAGIFENMPKEDADVIRAADKPEEILPEQGTAKSLLSKFKQMESESGHKPPSSPKREITPDRSGKVEYVSEPHGFLEKYEQKIDVGEFESTPTKRAEVIRAENPAEDILPEVGSAKKTMERFKEIQKQQTSSVIASRSKEFTPPREHEQARASSGIVESTPVVRADVVKSGESASEELPEKGSTRNILNKFKEIQSSTPQSTSPGRRLKEFTPPPEAGVYENTPKEHLVIETRQSESGIIESTPSKSNADVSRGREAMTPEQELPEQGMAKNLVSKWKQMESSSAKSTSSASPKFKEFTPPKDNRGPMSPKSPSRGINNGVHPSELPGQYQPQESSRVHENDPEVKKDVYRESDSNFEADLPPPNTTASMLQKFKTIQDKAKEDQGTAVSAAKKEKGLLKVVQTEKCSACDNTVYAMEKLEMNGSVYHKNCFKCYHCSARLTAKTFSTNEGVIFCINHFKQLFARKGNYDEGFGRQAYKKKWTGDQKKEVSTA